MEKKIDEAIKMIVDIRKEKEKLKKENLSLKQQLDSFKTEVKEYKKKLKNEFSGLPLSGGRFDSREVKKRLRKLTAKLAALEDSWN